MYNVLIIPALNEAECIGATLDRVPANLFHRIVVADNGSSDETTSIARLHGATVVREPRRGYGAACLRAIDSVPTAETIVFLQADLSEDPAEAAILLAPILEGRADLVLGSRTLGAAEPGSLTPVQKFGNWLATSLIRLFFGHRYTDLCGFRAIRADSLKRLNMQDRTYGWTIEMQVKALRHGLRVIEIPVSYRRRLAGENKISGNLKAVFFAGTKIIWTVVKLAILK